MTPGLAADCHGDDTPKVPRNSPSNTPEFPQGAALDHEPLALPLSYTGEFGFPRRVDCTSLKFGVTISGRAIERRFLTRLQRSRSGRVTRRVHRLECVADQALGAAEGARHVVTVVEVAEVLSRLESFL